MSYTSRNHELYIMQIRKVSAVKDLDRELGSVVRPMCERSENKIAHVILASLKIRKKKQNNVRGVSGEGITVASVLAEARDLRP